MNYDTYIKTITAYTNKIPLSTIDFLYFHANDLTKPKIRDTFRKFDLNGIPHYILNGFNKNFWYVYKESTIKYLVRVISSTPIFSEVQIINANPSYTVNHGDHIDFGLINLKSNDIVVKTHKTIYVDIGGFTFDRSAPECNFVLKNANTTTLSNFEKTNCVKPDNTVCNVMNKLYNNDDIAIIFHLIQVMTGIITIGGRRKVLKGGSIWDDEFHKYLQDNIIIPLSPYHTFIQDIKVFDDKMYDEGSICIIINFIEYTSFYVRLNKQIYKNIDSINILKIDIDKLLSILEAKQS